MFDGYLRFREICAQCGANFKAADAGDGPAVFVILAVGAIVAPLLIVLQVVVDLADWLALTITLVATVVLCLAFLPPFKATFFALQWRHKASEATRRDVE
ncbi:MAG: DUF983 domain-containing protein [Hyphomonadaceae bacterium]